MVEFAFMNCNIFSDSNAFLAQKEKYLLLQIFLWLQSRCYNGDANPFVQGNLKATGKKLFLRQLKNNSVQNLLI